MGVGDAFDERADPFNGMLLDSIPDMVFCRGGDSGWCGVLLFGFVFVGAGNFPFCVPFKSEVLFVKRLCVIIPDICS